VGLGGRNEGAEYGKPTPMYFPCLSLPSTLKVSHSARIFLGGREEIRLLILILARHRMKVYGK
jgi:hypothetical protein